MLHNRERIISPDFPERQDFFAVRLAGRTAEKIG
jgi:hypothetical protein